MKKHGKWLMLLASLLNPVIAVELPKNSPSTPDPTWLQEYNIRWTETGSKAIHSMPTGGGNIALNVWTTKDDLLFYLSSADSWNGQAQVKMGRVRISLQPSPFRKNFRQELQLADNSIHVSGQTEDGTDVSLQVWVDAFQPIVHVTGEASKPIALKASIEMLSGAQGGFSGESVEWHYRIEGPSPQRRDLIVKNHAEKIADAVPDPMENHTWGGRLSGVGMIRHQQEEVENEGQRTTAWSLVSQKPLQKIDIQATLRIAQDASLSQWQREVVALEKRSRSSLAADRLKTQTWWKSFWNRSFIRIRPGKSEVDPAWEVGRNYQLFRAMLATNRSGKLPTLFNGGPFLMEANPNERQWGHAGFTAQNQRLVHWPMLKSGDADLLQVGLHFYKDRHALAIAWAKHFWGIRGAIFPEDIDLFGLPVYTTKDASGHTAPACLRYHYVSCMEFALMMLQSHSYFGTDVKPYLPVADGILRFYDQFYRKQHKTKTGRELDAQGRLVIYPGNATESHAGTTNDAPSVAGLHALTNALLALPPQLSTASQKQFWTSLQKTLPVIPIHSWKGFEQLAPAASWESMRPDFNMEMPHLYPVYPFHAYGVGLPHLELARHAFAHGDTCPVKQKNHFCWYQGGLFAARLGLTEKARDYALAKFLHPRHPDPVEGKGWVTQQALSPWELRWARQDWEKPRFPAFWDGLIFCGRPDIDHGGSAMAQLQEMLLQTPGDQIHLFPAWPSDWDVDFKLHAPKQTMIEGSLREGQLIDLKVTPESRKADVVNWLGKVPEYAAPILISSHAKITASATWPGTGHVAAKANDDDIMTRWAASGDAKEATLSIEWDEEKDISRIWIAEVDFANTREFFVEAKQGDEWQEIARGTTIGANKVIEVPTTRTKQIRLRITQVAGPININEFQVYSPK